MKLRQVSLSAGGAVGSRDPAPRGDPFAADLLVEVGSAPDACFQAGHCCGPASRVKGGEGRACCHHEAWPLHCARGGPSCESSLVGVDFPQPPFLLAEGAGLHPFSHPHLFLLHYFPAAPRAGLPPALRAPCLFPGPGLVLPVLPPRPCCDANSAGAYPSSWWWVGQRSAKLPYSGCQGRCLCLDEPGLEQRPGDLLTGLGNEYAPLTRTGGVACPPGVQ